MFSLSYLLNFAHLLGLALGVGGATVKTILLLKGNSDYTFFPAYTRVARALTKTIIVGLILLALSGIGLIVRVYGITTLLIVKIVIVGLVLVIGPLIDNVFEPRLHRLMPAAAGTASPEFVRAQKQHLMMELIATGLMYAAMIIGTQL